MNKHSPRPIILKLFQLSLIGICFLGASLGYADKIVAAWGRCGSSTYGPDWLADAKAICCGYGTNFAISSNGVVMAWTQPDPFGQSIYYPGVSNGIAVAAGASNLLVLHNDGTLSAWGQTPYVPPGLSNVTAIAAGASHFLALRNDGSVVAWGNDDFGQIDVPSGLANVTAIAAGDYHSLALKQDGTVVSWGSNTSGQTNVPAGLTDITAIAGGSAHSLALDITGRVIAWGSNSAGQANVPLGLSNVTAIAAGTAHNVALKANGTIVAWGQNIWGQTNIPLGLSHAVAISARALGSLAMLSGDIPPLISYQPTGGTVVPGGTLYSLGLGQGSFPLAYQWRHNGTNIARTGTVVRYSPAQQAQSGAYSVVVSNAFGAQESLPAIWVVTSSTKLSLLLRPVAGWGLLPGLDAGFQVVARDDTGASFLPGQPARLQLETSTNLWSWTSSLGGLILTNGLLLIQDPETGTQPRRFYRVKQQ